MLENIWKVSLSLEKDVLYLAVNTLQWLLAQYSKFRTSISHPASSYLLTRDWGHLCGLQPKKADDNELGKERERDGRGKRIWVLLAQPRRKVFLIATVQGLKFYWQLGFMRGKDLRTQAGWVPVWPAHSLGGCQLLKQLWLNSASWSWLNNTSLMESVRY